jgi:hypothetical protein
LFGVAHFDGGANGDFYGWGGCGGDFLDIGDFGGADFGVGDARNVLVDAGCGEDCAGASCRGWEIGDGEGVAFAGADEFADEINRRQGSRETGKQEKPKSEVLLTQRRRDAEKDKAEKDRAEKDRAEKDREWSAVVEGSE